MKRLSNALRIADIEFVIGSPPPGSLQTTWTVHNVDCERHRHQYTGSDHAFTIDVVHLKHLRKNAWHAAIITESWRFSQDESQPRTTKVIKMLHGQSSDVLAWMRQYRVLKLDQTQPAQQAGAYQRSAD